MGGKLLNALALKVDNVNNHIVINSLYASKMNLEGVYSAIWNEKDVNWISLKLSELGKLSEHARVIEVQMPQRWIVITLII